MTDTSPDRQADDYGRLLTRDLEHSYDFIVCGSGSSGSVVARRLAENPHVRVLLLEAGGSDTHADVTEAARWPANLGSDRDWGFTTRPGTYLNQRSLLWSMGKVLGGGSSVNVMIWARGHKQDWDYFAEESGDPAWSYDEVLKTYRTIEDWQGEPDPVRRGTGGIVYVQPAPNPHPVAHAMLEACEDLGFPLFPDQNGALMEGEGGCALTNVRLREGKRLSVFRSYLFPFLHQPNLTVRIGALVTRVMLERGAATGVEVVVDGVTRCVRARHEVVLSLGAIHTPKILMLSGIGDADQLSRLGIDVVQDLPGVGNNLQEHILIGGCVWEAPSALEARNNGCEATVFARSNSQLPTPDLHLFQFESPFLSSDSTYPTPPPDSWSLLPGVVRTLSRGRLRLTGSRIDDPLDIDANLLSEPGDLRAAVCAVELCREIGNSVELRPFVKKELVPGPLCRGELENFVRNSVVPFWHQTCTAKMGRDSMSVVDGHLNVYGVRNLRVADGSIMPRVTTGNTMAPCVIIGERAAEAIRQQHGL